MDALESLAGSSSSRNSRPICNFYGTTRGCRNGDACRFRHVLSNDSSGLSGGLGALGSSAGGDLESDYVAEVASRFSLSPRDLAGLMPGSSGSRLRGKTNQVCRYFGTASGCIRGDACFYKHDLALSTSSSSASGSQTLADRSTSTIVATPPSPLLPEPCAICFEEEPKTYGLLTSCPHAFCLACIRSWRDTLHKDRDSPLVTSGVTKACPVCRTASRFIVPSAVWLGEKTAEDKKRKDEFVERYKNKMATIPCRYFSRNPSHPYCPFGFDCFYEHKLPDGSTHVFTHGLEEMRQRAADRQDRDRREMSSRARTGILDTLGRMQTRDFDIFVEAMAAEFARSDLFGENGVDYDFDDGDEDDLYGEEDEDEEDDDVEIELDFDQADQAAAVEAIYQQLMSHRRETEERERRGGDRTPMPVISPTPDHPQGSNEDVYDALGWGGPYSTFGRPRLSDFERYREPTLPYGSDSEREETVSSSRRRARESREASGRNRGRGGAREESSSSWGREAAPW